MRSTFLCLAVLAQLALNAAAETSVTTVPLYKRTEDGGIYKAAGKALDNGVLAGKVNIGKPPQEFVVAFDTTTGFSWVRGSRCKSTNCKGRCTYYSTQSDTVKGTGEKFSVEYGDACVDTHVYLETFEFAGLTVENFPIGSAYHMKGFGTGFDGYLGLGRPVDFNSTKYRSSTAGSLAKRDTLPSSAFAQTAFQQGSGVASSQFGMYTTSDAGGSFDQSGTTSSTGTTGTTGNTGTTGSTGSTGTTGTTGTTNTTTSAIAGTTSTPVNPSSTDTVTSGGFGIVKRHNVEEQPAGYLVLGGVDKSVIKGDVEYLRLADTLDGSDKNWDICIRHASFGDELKFKQEENAIASISTATSFIAMPPVQADAFHAKFGAEYDPNTKLYKIKCSEIENLPTLKMTLEDHIVELPPKYWTAAVDTDRDCCTTKIGRGSSERDWVLGTSFTSAFYTTFDPDNETLGLAIKKGQKDDGLRVYRKSH